MKKSGKTKKSMVALMLSAAMVISIGQTVAFPAMAADEIVLDFIPAANETAEDTTAIGTTATIKGTSVEIYEDLYYGATGVEVAVAENTEIDLITAYEFSNGAVVYRFDYWGSESPELYDAVLDYCFISANDITVAGEEVKPEATATPAPTATPEAGNSIVDYGSMSETMYIASSSLTLYKTHIDDEETTAVSGVKNEKVNDYFYYELSDGTVKYKVEYAGRKSSLRNAINGGYDFIKADDLSTTKSNSKGSFGGWGY